jgi:DNA-binding LacI/PurR family transcriptional regulator
VKDKHVTVYDVAKRAGVSAATVSRALTGTKVKTKNQAKIQQAARDLGYVPNSAARSLRNVNTMTVGAVFHTLSGALGIELISALSWGLEQRGYSLFVSTAQGNDEQYDKLVHRFLERRVDALLCIHGSGTGAALDRFIAANIPVASLISQSGGYKRLPLIRPSVQKAAQACVARLKELGHRRMHVLQPDRPRPALDEFAAVAAKEKMTVTTEAIKSESFDAEVFLKRIIGGARAPTTIAGHQTEIARIFTAADKLSIDIPSVLSIVALRDRALQVPQTRLPLAIINLDPSILGRIAAELIVGQLAGDPKIKNTEVDMGFWIERGTIGPAR